MVQPLGGGEIHQLIPGHGNQLAQHLLQGGVFHLIDGRGNLAQHLLGRIGRAGHQQRHIHLIGLLGLAQLVHPQLQPPVILRHHGAHLDDGAVFGGLHRAIPHFGVDIARAVAQRHIQIPAAIGGGALLGRAHQQKAFKF